MDFNLIWNILDNSFPKELHRNYENQKKLLNNENYHINTYEKDLKCLGFLSYWNFDDFLYIEHFAVDESSRGKGIGKKLLKDFMLKPGLKVLEVEPPDTEIDKKRIKFYEEFGFYLNKQVYYQPPYNEGDEMTKLFIMSTEILGDNRFKKVVKKLYEDIYLYNN